MRGAEEDGGSAHPWGTASRTATRETQQRKREKHNREESQAPHAFSKHTEKKGT